jgi:hypothetical protein
MSEPKEPERPTYAAEDLPELYQRALETGDAAELVRALCSVWGVNLRGLAELTGITYRTLSAWTRNEQQATQRTIRDLQPLLKPNRAMQRRIADVCPRAPLGLKGRPKKPDFLTFSLDHADRLVLS